MNGSSARRDMPDTCQEHAAQLRVTPKSAEVERDAAYGLCLTAPGAGLPPFMLALLPFMPGVPACMAAMPPFAATR
eukprot:3601266-Rhodomonas_salina.1